MDTTLTVEQQRAMARDMADLERAQARIEAVQRGGAQ